MKHHHCRLAAEISGGALDIADSVALEPNWLYPLFILQNNILATGGVRYTRENWIPCLKITLEGCPYELGPYMWMNSITHDPLLASSILTKL